MELLGMLLVLVLVLVSSEAQNQVDVNVTLGQDVTLTCSYNGPVIHWFMEDQNQSRIRIGEMSRSKSLYESEEFKCKFSISEKKLVVRKFSAEDSRRYFCGRKESGTFIYLDAFRISSDRPTACPTSAPSLSCPAPLNVSRTRTEWHKEPVVVASFTLNAVLVLVVLGFTAACIRRNGCSCSCRAEESAENIVENQEMQIPQYEEIQLPRASSECIYSKAWHPASMDPHY